MNKSVNLNIFLILDFIFCFTFILPLLILSPLIITHFEYIKNIFYFVIFIVIYIKILESYFTYFVPYKLCIDSNNIIKINNKMYYNLLKFNKEYNIYRFISFDGTRVSMIDFYYRFVFVDENKEEVLITVGFFTQLILNKILKDRGFVLNNFYSNCIPKA